MIEDGTGSGQKVEIDTHNRLQTLAVTMPKSAERALEGQFYAVATPFLTGTTNGGTMIYVKNTSKTQRFFIESISGSYNGGSTNRDRSVQVVASVDVGAPSANNTASTAGNLNLTSANVAELDVEYWDEVGDGMTIVAGTEVFRAILNKGYTRFRLDGSVVMGLNDTFAIAATVEEVGELTLSIQGYFDNGN